MIDLSRLGPVSVDEKRDLLKNLLNLQTSASTGQVALSYGQTSLWFLYQLAPESPAYNFLYAARILTALDLNAFRRACRALVDRHPLLRTRFVVMDHKPIQQVEEKPALDIPVTDVSSWSDEQIIAELRRRADLPFRLEQVPCVRIELFQRSAREWVLLLVFPHIVADLWSADLLLQELRQLYTALERGEPAGLPPLSVSFADFVRWQMMHVYSERGQKSKRYWHEILSGELPVLDLPTDRPRPPVQTYNGTASSWALKPELVRRVRALAVEEAATPFAALLGVFELLLHRLSSQDDILVGTAAASRDRPEWERVVGYFLNQVVFRTRFSGNRSFRQLLQEARDQGVQALEHQSYPFGLLVKQLHPKRDPARTPIFQVMFIWDKPRDLRMVSPSAEPAGKALEMHTLLMEQRGAPFDLTLILFEVGDELTACFRYNSDLFDQATIERWAGHFNTLLEALVAAPDAPLSEVSLLTESESRQILLDWNRTQSPYPLCGFPELFEQQVRKAPTAVAVASTRQGSAESLTYDELSKRANQLAHHLRELGVGRGDVVAISLPREIDLVVAVLAVWKAGAAFLFLDPASPPKRLQAVVAELKPAALIGVLAGKGSWGRHSCLPERGADIPVCLNPTADRNVCPTPPDIGAISPEDPAYIIYTSGSTGQPKGVILRQRGVCNLLTAQQALLRLGPGDRVLQFASFSFDAAVWELISALGCGSTLVLADVPSLMPGRPLWQLLAEQAITCVTLPPSALALVPVEPLPQLRTLVVAGEACSTQLVDAWAPGRRFINAYGPTEATVCATAAECVPHRRPTIGRPIANTRVYVLDRDLQPVPVGVAGELYLAGPGLAAGYVNRPELTAERFLPCPFDQADEATMYRTGDVVRWTSAGELEFLGRADHQVKVRGYRIELEEIEAVLKAHPGILDAVAVVRKDSLPSVREDATGLAAYVIPRQGTKFVLADVRAYLRERLPHYMLPGAIVPLESFPVGSTGKVDRARLPAPQAVAESHGGTQEREGSPRTPLERLLAQLWCRVLTLERVGVQDNFFDLGGASTQVLEVVALARAQGVTLSPEMLFRHQTIADLAGALSEQRVDDSKRAGSVSDGPDSVANASGSFSLASGTLRCRLASSAPGAVIESMGVYLPQRVLTTDEILKGCRHKIDFPLERLTGIRSRRVAGDGEYSIDLAEKAVAECLRRSAHKPAEIDLVICCNISRCDGPMFQFSLEPTSAARICRRFGMVNALAFDLTNACAGTFTAILLADAFIRQGLIERAMIVSGEYITHLMYTVDREIDNFLDPRLACLTLGDSGAAVILEKVPHAAVGFQEIELYTLGKYHDLCVARLSPNAGSGPIMHTDSVTSTGVTIKQAVGHALEVLHRKQWELEKINALVIHQTSETTLDGAIHEINRAVGKPVCHRGNTIYNVAERGNTATNTHMLALWERIQAGDFQTGNRVLFAVSGSGQAVGTALYTLDDLPQRLRQPATPHLNGKSVSAPAASSALRHYRCPRRVRIESVGTIGLKEEAEAQTVDMLREAGEACLQASAQPRESIDLLIHTGVNRSDFLSEPAIAAIAAGILGINHDDSALKRRTLAFDILNGGAGALTGCFLAAQLLAMGKFSRALLLASEVDHNRRFWPENLLGLVQTASALVLEESGSGAASRTFAVRSFPEHADAIVSTTGARDNRPVVVHHHAPDLDDRMVDCICRTVQEWSAREALPLGEVRLVVAPGRVGLRVAEALHIEPDRLVSLEGEQDYFTSSLANVFQKLRQQPGSSAPVLFIEVAAGLQVWCALYSCNAAEAHS